MKKFTLIFSFLLTTVAIMAQTAEITVSTSTISPEYAYTLKSGSNLYMSAYTSPTNLSPARFAFYAVEDVENAYYIYSVDRGEWVSYTKADSYSSGRNFAKFAATKEEANYWNATITQANSVNYYQFAPYKTDGVASMYMNWYEGVGKNPVDNTNTTIGLYSTNGAGDSGSRWTLEAATSLASEEEVAAVKALVKTTVGYPTTTSAGYKAVNALAVGTSTTKNVELAKNAYLAETNIILPVDGKAYTIANKGYDGTLRYITYTKGQKPTVPTTSSEGSVFVCKKINNAYVFITNDGSILTWIGNDDSYAYNENGVYGYSTYYATTFNNKNDWNNITLAKQTTGDATTVLGTINMQGRRNASNFSSFVVKTTENRFDQANTSHFFSHAFSSAFIFTEVEHTNNDAQNVAIAKIGVKTNGKTVGEAIGLYSFNINDEKVADYTQLDAATTVDAVNTMANALEFNAPATGKYYRLKNYVSNNYMSANADGSVKVITDGSTAASTIFYLAEDSKLLSYTQGRFLDCLNKNLAAIGNSYNGEFAVACNGPAANVIMYRNNGYWTYGDRNNNISIDRGQSTPSKTQTGYNWYIEEVTELPVTISIAGYATLYLPVATTINSDVEAYTVSNIGSTSATLSQIDGTIPANTGVILKAKNELSEATTFSFAIAEDVAAIDNKLEGSAEARSITPAANTTYYILAVAGGEVGLYPDALDGDTFQNNANKAYLPVASENAAAGYSFVFDWAGTTGVEGVVAEGAQNGKIYDITGREVKAITVPGIYIVNGQKVVK